MSDLYGLKLEPMANKLVNYGVTNNGIAVIELTSDSAGAPLEGPNDRSPNTYTHGMMRDIDEAIVKQQSISSFLKQPYDKLHGREESFKMLRSIF